MALRRAAGGNRLVGILECQLVQAESAVPRDLEGAVNRILMPPEEPDHLGSALEMALGVDGKAPTCLRHGNALPDRGQDVLEGTALGCVIVDIVGGDQRHGMMPGKARQPVEAASVIAPEKHVGCQVKGTVMEPAQPGKHCREPFGATLPPFPARIVRRQRDQHLPLGMRLHVGHVKHAATLGCATLAQGQQAAQPTIGGAIPGIAEKRKPGSKIEPCPDQQVQAGRLCRNMGAHSPGKAVAISNAKGGKPQLHRPFHQLVRVRSAAQEAEIAHRLQFGIGDRPCHP